MEPTELGKNLLESAQLNIGGRSVLQWSRRPGQHVIQKMSINDTGVYNQEGSDIWRRLTAPKSVKQVEEVEHQMSDTSYSLNARCLKCKISAEQLLLAEKRQMPKCEHYWMEPQQRYAPAAKWVSAAAPLPPTKQLLVMDDCQPVAAAKCPDFTPSPLLVDLRTGVLAYST
jgi:hypothetical protein